MSIKIGDKVQCWDEANYNCIGWGKIIRVGISTKDQEEIPLIQLENGRLIWGNLCAWITEEAAIKAGIRIWKAIKENEK